MIEPQSNQYVCSASIVRARAVSRTSAIPAGSLAKRGEGGKVSRPPITISKVGRGIGSIRMGNENMTRNPEAWSKGCSMGGKCEGGGVLQYEYAVVQLEKGKTQARLESNANLLT